MKTPDEYLAALREATADLADATKDDMKALFANYTYPTLGVLLWLIHHIDLPHLANVLLSGEGDERETLGGVHASTHDAGFLVGDAIRAIVEDEARAENGVPLAVACATIELIASDTARIVSKKDIERYATTMRAMKFLPPHLLRVIGFVLMHTDDNGAYVLASPGNVNWHDPYNQLLPEVAQQLFSSVQRPNATH